jgi:Helix-turn-helix domain
MNDLDEKFLNSLLANPIRSGQTSDLTDEVVDRILAEPAAEVSETSKAHIKSRLKHCLEDAAIVRASIAIKVQQATPLGRYVETVRERAGLERTAVGTRLHKTADFVERFERGHINPLQLPTTDFADITELFRIKLSVLPAMIAASTATAGAKHGYRAIARSHGGIGHDRRGEDVERALEAFARSVKPKAQSGGTPGEVQTYLAKVEIELKRRGRTDLTT